MIDPFFPRQVKIASGQNTDSGASVPKLVAVVARLGEPDGGGAMGWHLSVPSPVRYAKFESIRYFIDIDILQNCLIDIDIDIFQNHHVDIDIDIDIFQNHLINIDIDIDIFGIALSISISIFSTSPYRY